MTPSPTSTLSSPSPDATAPLTMEDSIAYIERRLAAIPLEVRKEVVDLIAGLTDVVANACPLMLATLQTEPSTLLPADERTRAIRYYFALFMWSHIDQERLASQNHYYRPMPSYGTTGSAFSDGGDR